MILFIRNSSFFGVWLYCLLHVCHVSYVESFRTFLISTVAGTGSSGTGADNLAGVSTSLKSPAGVWQDSNGNLFISDTGNHVIRYLDTSNIMHVYAGTLGVAGFTGDNGPPKSGTLRSPNGICGTIFGGSFALAIADQGNHVLRTVYQGQMYTAAGTGVAGSADGYRDVAPLAQFNSPSTCRFDSNGNVLIAEAGSNKIRLYNSITFYVSTFIGTGSSGSLDDVASAATMSSPYGIYGDTTGNTFFSDTTNHKVRFLSTLGGSTSVFAGTGTSGLVDNCDATLGRISSPKGVWSDSAGNLFIADSGNNRIRVVDTAGNSIFCH
jgi:streptogramin lyase